MAACATQKTQTEIQIEASFDASYPTYARLLDSSVVGELVDYEWLAANRAPLDTTVARFASLDSGGYETMSRQDRMALWLNAYNAITLRSIIDHHPVRSIKEIDGVWTGTTWPVAGRTVTLDQIEHDILRPVFEDARIHFAVNCASIGCPPLAEVPYIGDSLDVQLDRMARRFVNDPERTMIDSASGVMTVTEIFDWFGEDFVGQFQPAHDTEGLSQTERAVVGFVITYADDSLRAVVTSRGNWEIAYRDYDWSLNDLQ